MIELWHPFSTNATPYGLVMFITYLTAALLCAFAARECHTHPGYRRGGARIRTMRRERLLWQGITATLVVLAIYRQFDLADLITSTGRSIAVGKKWYDGRHPYQRAAVALIAIAVVVGAAAIFTIVRAVNPLALMALVACSALVLLLAVNVISLHGIDAFLRIGVGRVKVYNLVEFGSIATILAMALLYRQQIMAVRR